MFFISIISPYIQACSNPAIHYSGRATWTKHVRDGVELPEIARDDNYDFNFQVIIAVLYGSANDPQIEPQMILGPVSRKLP